jgi:Outer membrane protein beta-barrel domain
MKKLMLLAFCILSLQLANAQFKIGVRGGLSTMDISANELIVTNKDDIQQLKIAVADANYGVHFGFFIQAQMGKFFIQPEVLFNSSSVEYRLDDFTDVQVFSTLKKETFQNLDLPIMVGAKFGPLRLQGGPVGHVFINSTSELFDIDGYSQKFETMTWGYQAGIGLDIWKFLFDIKYEGNFKKFGDHMVFSDKAYSFDDSPGRFIASVGFAF